MVSCARASHSSSQSPLSVFWRRDPDATAIAMQFYSIWNLSVLILLYFVTCLCMPRGVVHEMRAFCVDASLDGMVFVHLHRKWFAPVCTFSLCCVSVCE